MKTITVEVSDTHYSIMCLRLLDPQAHLANFAETMVHHAMQELGYSTGKDGQYSDADIKEALAMPSAADREAARLAKQKIDDEAALTAKELQDKLDKDAADARAAKQAEQDALAAEQYKQDVMAAAQSMMPDVLKNVDAHIAEQVAAQVAALTKAPAAAPAPAAKVAAK